MRKKQLDFFDHDPDLKPGRLAHGGEHIGRRTGRRRLARPLNAKRPLHLVLKSSAAKGKLSFLTHKVAVDRIVNTAAKKFGVRIHERANVGNHLHFVLSFSSRDGFKRFLKTITGLISRHITGDRKGKPFGRRFWDHTAFTRVIVGYRAYWTAWNYIEKNKIESQLGKAARGMMEEFEQAVRMAKKFCCSIDEAFRSTA